MNTAGTGYCDPKDGERLSTENLSRIVKGLPAKAQMVLRGLVHMQAGCLKLTLPDSRTVVVKGKTHGPVASVTLHNWNLPQRALTGGTIAVAESYMDGDWDSPDVGAFLELFLVNTDVGYSFSNGARGVLRLVEKFRHWMNANTKTGSKKNISAHYDLGNDFYKQWLDPTMTYSSALYSTGANDLQSAQRAKYKAWRMQPASGTGITCWRSAAAGAVLPNMQRGEIELQGDRPDDQPRTARLRQ
jgi:cyclopropane-fatty-acyl-phospholipid synthase